MITLDDYFAHMKSLGYAPTPDIEANATALLEKVNVFIEFLKDGTYLPIDYEIKVNSGWRSPAYNEKLREEGLAACAVHSNHMTGHAIDIGGNEIIKLCEEFPYLLQKHELHAEAGADTPTWTHLQNLPPGSGVLIFRA
jgi:hypothetical protein